MSHTKNKKPAKGKGKKYRLLMYYRTMDRVWGITLLLGVVLFALYFFGGRFTDFFRDDIKLLILAAAGIVTFIGIFAFFARNMGYVQAHANYLLVATPFYRFKTSYRRLKGVRSTELHRLFDIDSMKWSEQKYLEPFIGETAVVVQLKKYPVSEFVLRLFFQKYFLSPKGIAFVVLVPDWMAFSIELDSRYNDWRDRNRRKKKKQGFQRGMY